MENKVVPKKTGSKAEVFDIEKDFNKLTEAQQYYNKKFKKNIKWKWEGTRIFRKTNRMYGVGLSLFAFGIYVYTIYSVKQEKFLDEGFNKLPDNMEKES